MEEKGMIQRWRHPGTLIFLLGGVLGTVVNLSTTVFLVMRFSAEPPAAFFLGTFLNQAFHYVFYHVVYVNQEIRMRTSLGLHLFLSLFVSFAAGLLLSTFLSLGWGLPAALLASIFLLAAANAVLNRVSTFSSAKMAEVEYREMNESFYDDQTDETKVSKFRAWYHRSRYERMTAFVMGHFKKGMRMADLGCGNCWWNVHGVPVTGVDINAKMLKWGKKNGRLKDFKVASNLGKTGLPTRGFHLVLMSEVLEHVFDHKAVLAEVRRVLKDDGTFLITVPYDFFMGPFFVLFNLNCLYMGYVKGSVYHKYRCGHIHHFTKTRLRETLAENGFALQDVFVVNGLLLYATAKKDRAFKG